MYLRIHNTRMSNPIEMMEYTENHAKVHEYFTSTFPLAEHRNCILFLLREYLIPGKPLGQPIVFYGTGNNGKAFFARNVLEKLRPFLPKDKQNFEMWITDDPMNTDSLIMGLREKPTHNSIILVKQLPTVWDYFLVHFTNTFEHPSGLGLLYMGMEGGHILEYIEFHHQWLEQQRQIEKKSVKRDSPEDGDHYSSEDSGQESKRRCY